MKKCIFIVPYFGKLPDYFPLFLKTCKSNKDFDWLILTDDMTNFTYPANVHRVYYTFNKLRKKVQSVFDFKIHLNNYQKLCDYKPCYGYIFEHYISNYKFWGYCDVDILWGNINKFLPSNLDCYDKLFELGHCTLFKNTPENNRMFMKKLRGVEIYKWSYSQDQVTTFDEIYGNNPDINDIFLNYRKKVFRSNYAFDVQPAKIFFQDANYDYKTGRYLFEPHYWKKLSVWRQGGILRFYQGNNSLISDEYMYIHLQDRKMGWSKQCLTSNEWKIVPEYIKPLKQDVHNLKQLKRIWKINIDPNSLIYFLNRFLAFVKHSFLGLMK